MIACTVIRLSHRNIIIENTPEATVTITFTPIPLPAPSPESNKKLGHQISMEIGMSSNQWKCLDNLAMRESGWKHDVKNKKSGAYGIPQSLPASKLDSYGDRTNPEVQINWMIDYIKDRYGTPCNALSFQMKNNWY